MDIQVRSRLLAAGFSADEIRGLRRTGDLALVRRGCYVAGSLPQDRAARHLLQVSATVGQLADGAVVSHVSAALLHGLPVWALPLERVHVTRSRASGGRKGSLVHVHVAPLEAADVVAVNGTPTTSVARTVADLARTVPFERAVVVADGALFRGLVDADDLRSAVAGCAGWPGSPRARRIAAFADARAESVGESRSRVAIHRVGLPGPVPQWEVIGRAGRRIARVDFGWPELMTVGEFDGRVKYGRLLCPGQAAGDAVFEEKRREDALRDEDLGVVRWTWAELDDFAPVAVRLRRRFRPG